MNNLIVPTSAIETTLEALRRAGAKDSEAVLLWLGRADQNGVTVLEPYMPEQEAAHDYFHIPPRAMSALLTHLGNTNTFIAAQVHSHPKEAFHSYADDKWAIVRHQGALSLVVPYFATDTFSANFMDKIAAFRLSATNVWEEMTTADRSNSIHIL